MRPRLCQQRLLVILLATMAMLSTPVLAQASPWHARAEQRMSSPAAPALTSATVSPQTAKTWYFAEGYTGGTFQEWLTLANPGANPANATVTYLLEGMASVVRTYRINPYARYTVMVNSVIPGASVSMLVNADQPIVAERPMYFVDTDNPGTPVPGGTNTLGATTLNSTYQFAYLDTTANHTTWLTLLNQNGYAIDARITYHAPNGTAYVHTHTFGAHSRGTVNVNQEAGLPAGSYSATVELFQQGTTNPAPGMVERPMYFKDSQTGWTGSADVLGVPSAQTSWSFAEGYTGSNFSERYILANPSPNASASATVTFMLKNGQTRTTPTVNLGPGQQQVIDVNTFLGSAGGDNSAVVHASGPILADRFISFNYFIGRINTQVPGASETLGTSAPGNWFYFAEGWTGNQFDEWLTIQNPDSSRTAYVLVSFLPDNGSLPTQRVYYIGPTTRFTLLTNGVMPGQSFSMVVQSSVPIVAERPMYFAYDGTDTGGSSVIGSQPTGPVVTPDPSSCTPAFGVIPVSTSLIYTGNSSQRQVSLTFDSDGGPAGNATSYLNTLRTDGVQATWFLTAQFAQANPSIVQQIRDNGHDIGNHTIDHPDLISPPRTNAFICNELVGADNIVSDTSGRTTRPFFRPPYGDNNAQVRTLAGQLGFRTIYWSIDPADWDSTHSAQYIENAILNSPNLKPGAIILMHINSAHEPEALPVVIAGLKQRGFSIVPLSQLLQ